jgi:hypothetical protein
MNASVSQSDNNGITIGTAEKAGSRSAGAIASEGVLAGVIAAAAVAAMFLVIDLLADDPFRTPKHLGMMLLSVFGSSTAAASTEVATPLALYTLFHFVAFILAGIVTAHIVQITLRQPIALLLFVILFFVFELAFTGLVASLDANSAGTLTPFQVAAGNVVATIAMAVFFLIRHPRLRTVGKQLMQDEE